jgi:glycosyltransferase involved in cell wall biosynthesis
MLYIAGNGDGNNIRRLLDKYDLNNHVKILGPLKSGEEVFKFLDSLNIYLHPSLTEGLPRGLIEAMSRACPALASSVGGIPELLDEKYLHQPGDYKELSKQIENYSIDKEKLLLMANENFIKTKEYTNSKLNKRRSKFFKNFRDSI